MRKTNVEIPPISIVFVLVRKGQLADRCDSDNYKSIKA